MEIKSKEELVKKLFDKGVLVDKELLEDIESKINSGQSFEELEQKILSSAVESKDPNFTVLSPENLDNLSRETLENEWQKEVDPLRIDLEDSASKDLYSDHLVSGTNTITSIGEVDPDRQKIIESAKKEQLKHEIEFKTNSPEFELDSNLKTTENQVNFKSSTSVNSASAISLDDLPTIPSNTKKISKEIAPNTETFENQHININYAITTTFEHKPKKYNVKDFAAFFKTRYKFLEKVIRAHPEMKAVTSISRVLQKKEKEEVNIIGVVFDIAQTKNGNLIMTLEDLTGQIKIIITKDKKDIFELAKEITFDEVIGVVGTSAGEVIFANDLVWPDLPQNREFKKAPTEDYALFLSDIHVGSTYFLGEAFEKFLQWIRGEAGSDSQKEIASKVKYIFIAGDVVDGIGIYPKQTEELTIKTIDGQYAEFARLIKKIPQDKKIFICPGNHDVVHLAEPQSSFYKKYTQDLHDMPNVELVSNPSMINIAAKDDFSGIDVLMYHGYSFDFYVANVDNIRNRGGYHRADLIMKHLLKRRHLAPAFKSTPYIPAYKEDPLLIKKVPDIMISGHIHYSSVANYKAVTMICGSCWQGTTKFQEKLGHSPEPGRVPIVNLKTREVKVLRFI